MSGDAIICSMPRDKRRAVLFLGRSRLRSTARCLQDNDAWAFWAVVCEVFDGVADIRDPTTSKGLCWTICYLVVSQE